MKLRNRDELFSELFAAQLAREYGDRLAEVKVGDRTVDIDRARETDAVNRDVRGSMVENAIYRALDWWGGKLHGAVEKFEAWQPKDRRLEWAKKVADRALENTILADAETVRREVHGTVKLKSGETLSLARTITDVQASRQLQKAALVAELVALAIGIPTFVIPGDSIVSGTFSALFWGMSKGVAAVGADDLARTLAHMAHKQLILAGTGLIPFFVGEGVMAAAVLDDAGELGRLSNRGVPVSVINDLGAYVPKRDGDEPAARAAG